METWLDERLGRPKLLLVDDQPMNIRVLHQLFRYECDVHMATGGEQAIEVCKALLPDLILLDVVMEGMDGHEVCRRLKADPLTQDIPIIFLSANGEEDDEAIGLELGAVDYIGKPFNPMIVRARVKTHLTLKRQGDYLRSTAMLDGLTGVANRRKLEARLEAAWSQACRDNGPLSLIMIDVDYFKKYNDVYGHVEGDKVLSRIGEVVKRGLRQTDSAFRYGGEEFAVILPMTDLPSAITAAERLADELYREVFSPASGEDVHITCSIGVALYRPNEAPMSFVQRADLLMYRAKSEGKNRVCAESVL